MTRQDERDLAGTLSAVKPGTIDILMITYNRPEYAQRSLGRLLETCDETMRVWIWHNGNDGPTLEVVRALANHPRVHEFYHCPENKKLWAPTNWFWEHARGDYLSKVDDDCVIPHGWGQILRKAHEDVPQFGVLGCWHFQEDDFDLALAEPKIRQFPGGHRVMVNCWLGGSGYAMKRECVESGGLLRRRQGFTDYCLQLARQGWIHGWYYPFLYMEHMDDPRAPHSGLRADSDVERKPPLSAAKNGIRNLAAWDAQLRRSARLIQQASIDPRDYTGWRKALGWLKRRARRRLGIKRQ